MLNVQQERFIQNIVKGMSQREAYKEAYNATYDNNAIDVNASKLFNEAKVQLRYKELLQELEDKSIMSAKERMKWLTDVINGSILEEVPTMTKEDVDVFETKKCPAKLDTKLRALDTLNKMSGEYTTKLEGNIAIEKLEDVL